MRKKRTYRGNPRGKSFKEKAKGCNNLCVREIIYNYQTNMAGTRGEERGKEDVGRCLGSEVRP